MQLNYLKMILIDHYNADLGENLNKIENWDNRDNVNKLS